MEYFNVIKAKWKWIIITILVGIITSFIYSFFIAKTTYEAEVKVFVGKEKFKNTSEEYIEMEEYTSDEVLMYQRLIKTHSELINSKDLLNAAIDKNSYELNLQEVRKSLSIEPVVDTQILKLKYESESAQLSYDMLYEITKVYIETIEELYPNINISLIQQTDVSTSSPTNKLLVGGGVGAILGACIAIGIIILLQITNNTFKTKEELEKYINLNVIGLIPKTEE